MNLYALEQHVQDRLTERLAEAERAAWIRAVRAASPTLRVRLGQALMRLGHRLRDVNTSSPRPSLSGGSRV